MNKNKDNNKQTCNICQEYQVPEQPERSEDEDQLCPYCQEYKI